MPGTFTVLNKYLLSKGMTIHCLENTEDPPMEGYPPNQGTGGPNGSLAIAMSPCSWVKGGTVPCLQPQTSPSGRHRTRIWVPRPSLPGRRRQKAPKTRVNWRGRRDRHVKQLVNQITGRLTVLYPDIIKYALYDTIRDKSEARRTNYTGQRPSNQEPRGHWSCRHRGLWRPRNPR